MTDKWADAPFATHRFDDNGMVLHTINWLEHEGVWTWGCWPGNNKYISKDSAMRAVEDHIEMERRMNSISADIQIKYWADEQQRNDAIRDRKKRDRELFLFAAGVVAGGLVTIAISLGLTP